MTLESAQQLVSRMKEDKDFREKLAGVADTEALWELLAVEGFDFDERDLVGAMAACMTELEKAVGRQP
jgi:predicted ribosomally synthesized peptide with nif11-like leader